MVNNLTKGDILKLELTNGQAPIVAKNKSGQIAGSIVINQLNALVDCLKAGRKFVAEVLASVGGAVKVRVRPE